MRVALGLLFCVLLGPLRADPSPELQHLLQTAHTLSEKNLVYQFGAADPASGALDCSGFIAWIFREAYGLQLPLESDLQYQFCRRYGRVWDRTTKWSERDLREGDLIFITGTWPSPRPSPITHVMLYAGNGRMIGAQSGGTRLDGQKAGIGYYAFRPIRPGGDPAIDATFNRTLKTVYAYGRLWPK